MYAHAIIVLREVVTHLSITHACRYNGQVFGGYLPADLDIAWSSKLRTTAGMTLYQRRADTDDYK